MFLRWTLTLLASIALTACGGGGSGDSAPSTPPSIDRPTPQPPGTETPEQPGTPGVPPLEVKPPEVDPPAVLPPVTEPPASSRIEQALRAGDSRLLQAEDQTELLQSATQLIQQTRLQQQKLLAQLLDDSTAATLDFGNNSQRVSPQLSTSASPLLVANNGNVLASMATAQNGRALAYGKDLLGQLATSSGTNQAQLPLFKRSLTWLATGKAQGPLPATLRIAAQNYSQASVTNLVARLGSKAEMVSCAITDPANSCWEGIDVFVFGQDTPFSASLSNQVSRYLQAGKGVIYLHSNWGDSAGGRQVLQAMGMELGGYAGNYWAPADGYQINGRNAVQQRQAADRLGTHESVLGALKNGSSADFSADTSLIDALDGIRNDLLGQEGQGINLFADNYYLKPYMAAHRRLVLWADLARQQVDYSQVRRSNANAFLRTMAADTLSYAVREQESVPVNFADWMPSASASLATSDAWETIEVTIAQTDGRTAIGRGAVPGKAVQVQIVDAADAALALRVGNIRTRGNPLAQENYTRPRFPDGHQARLNPGQTLSYSTAWGGPLFLNYAGAKAGSVVKLRIRGSVKYAHFDFTRNPGAQEIDEAVQALQRSDFGWQTSKMVGGEVQQTIGYAKSVIGNQSPRTYVVDRLKGMIFDSNHLTNGYNNMPPSANVSNLCATLGWDCTGSLQRAPGVQHFVGWLAACGFLCSGNPSDGSAGLSPGWGWWHELGHNTVMRHMTLLTDNGGGCPVECNNNILANASALRQYAITNGAENNSGERIDHKKLYQDIQAARATGKTGNDLQADMFQRFWTKEHKSDNAMRAVHFQLAFIYTRERLGQAQPQPADVIDFLGLLGRGERLTNNDTYWTAHKNALGMGSYTKNEISNHELLYVLSSRIIGRDMRQVFAHYGIPLGSTALDSIAAHGMSQLSPEFYAMVPNQGNQLERGQWLNLAGSVPAYPF
ncbi:MAG: ImpA family metalloprotease [Comamonas sp.]|nr:ImpA family metalloprotease [Comamonas sp.]